MGCRVLVNVIYPQPPTSFYTAACILEGCEPTFLFLCPWLCEPPNMSTRKSSPPLLHLHKLRLFYLPQTIDWYEAVLRQFWAPPHEAWPFPLPLLGSILLDTQLTQPACCSSDPWVKLLCTSSPSWAVGTGLHGRGQKYPAGPSQPRVISKDKSLLLLSHRMA